MNYKDYIELLNEKLESEFKKINLLYTNDSTKEIKIKELKKEYDCLKLIQIDDLNLSQSNYLFEKYNEIKESTTFSSIYHEDESYANVENFVIGTINLLPFFVYKYIKVSTKNGMLLIESKKLDELLKNIKDNITNKSSEENNIINYSDFMSLLNSSVSSELKIIKLGFCSDIYENEILNAYDLLKCKTVNEITKEQKTDYLKKLKLRLENYSDIDEKYIGIHCLFSFHNLKIVPFFALKYLEKGEYISEISNENCIKLIDEIENSLEDNNGGSSSMSLKPKKSKSLEI